VIGAGGPVALRYRDEGSGRPLLLVHGWGGDLRAWEPVMPGLASQHRVIRVDLRGHGRSPIPRHGYRPTDMAGDLGALIERLGIAPVIAVGHSMGGQVVSALAVEHPTLIAGVIVIGPAYGADDAEAGTVPARLAELRAAGAPAAVAQLKQSGEIAEQILATPGHVLADAFAGMYADVDAFGLRPASERYLARRRCRVLAIHSRGEFAEWEEKLRLEAGSKVVAWEGSSHFLHRDRPEDFASLVTDWVARIP